MTAVFSTFFRQQLFANANLMEGKTIKVALFRQAPDFVSNDSRYTGAIQVADLLTMSGWVEAAGTGYPLTNSIDPDTRVEGLNRYMTYTSFPFTGMGPSEVSAVAFYLNETVAGEVTPLIFISNTPFPEHSVVKAGDAITSFPDSNLSGAVNRWLFSWATPPVGATSVSPGEGPLTLTRGAPFFEVSHTQHVWLYPQRANMIANPSFEKDVAFWSGNSGVPTKVPEPATGDSFQAGRFTGPGPTIAESNVFPTNREEFWTIQLMAKGDGDCKIGFVWWDDDFEEVAVDWGTEVWSLQPDTYSHLTVCREPVQTYQGMLRIECTGTFLTIDQVLVEKGFLKDWPYFDGASTYGARGDFSWYGGEVRQHATYSLWYNNKNAVYGALFDRDIKTGQLVTDEVLADKGIVFDWVPAGTIVEPHIDVLYPNDLQAPIPPKSAGVLPYRVDIAADLHGVVNPWV